MDGKAQGMQARKAIITGVTGQDGYYLSRKLLELRYEVVGLVRPESYGALMQKRFDADCDLDARIDLRPMDLSDAEAWEVILEEETPCEIYHLAGTSFVPDSWNSPVATIDANISVTVKALEALRKYSPNSRFFYACSSEIFGRSKGGSQNESTPLHPISPYGVTKAASHNLIDVYRRQYGIFACSGVLFNHESPRRPISFVTRKISAAAAAIATGLQDSLTLGNIESRRDWGYAGDYVDCMWRMLQSDTPKDYVIGTGRHSTIRQLLDYAFGCVDLDWAKYLRTDERFARANDVHAPLADASAAKNELGWSASTSVQSLMEMMVEHDLRNCTQVGHQRRAA